MKTKVKLLFTGVVVLLLLAGVTRVALAATTLNIPLNNDTAGVGTDCPLTGSPYWHFVISPNNGDSYFITFHLNLGDATTYDTSIYVPNGSQMDNVFVGVPSGKTLTSLDKDGSSADIIWSGDGNAPTKFQLSSVCEGSTPPEIPNGIKTADGSYDLTYTWDISKKLADDEPNTQNIPEGGSATFNYVVSVAHDDGEASNISLGGDITVTNPNGDPITGVTITDAVQEEPTVPCTVTGGVDATLVPGDNVFPYSCAYTDRPLFDDETNIATVTWPTQTLSNGELEGGSIDPPITKPFTFTVNPIDECVTITDPNAPDGVFPKTVCVGDANPTEIKYSQSFSGEPGTCTDYPNVATATTNDTGTTIDSDPPVIVTVCVGKDLTVDKTAEPSFTRTYNWTISKSVDPKLIEQVGGTATFNYTVQVDQTGITDSGWALSGKSKITITNPNDWEDIIFDASDAVYVDDAVDPIPGVECKVTPDTDVKVEASASVDLPYTCTFAAKPDYNTDLTNIATATWDNALYFTPTGSASGKAKFHFTTPTTLVNQTVNVYDTFNGGTAELLGTVIATDEAPWASGTWSYPRTVNVPAFNCVKYPNIATLVDDKTGDLLGSAPAQIEVCGPAKTGALTMGYWQNKNGQGIITSGASLSGVCKSGTWLRKYLPFQDLSATATCSGVATYVYNIVKAANASGASMNAMLKSQMLATALDVYFSKSTLGGNKIGAPSPIGAWVIDLTKIKVGGSYQNVSSAFGGATSMSIYKMLCYAASKSNVGGSLWYGQVKATQEKAKNAFDAINNQWVFAP